MTEAFWAFIGIIVASIASYIAILKNQLREALKQEKEAKINEIKTKSSLDANGMPLPDLIAKLNRIRAEQRPPNKKE